MKVGLLIAGLVLAVGLTLVGGLLHGAMSGRWGAERAGLAAGEELEQLPAELNDWTQRDRMELDESAASMLQCYGQTARTYFDPTTGQSVQMTLIVGPTGPTSEHTAEVCMPSREYKQMGARLKAVLGGHEFWYVDFKRNDLSGTRVRVYWAWSTGGPWEAPVPGLRPGGARLRYAGEPYLYKIQVSCILPAGVTGASDTKVPDPASRFLRDSLPAIQPHLLKTSS